MRLGIFGGTFDPIHLAHLLLAESCLESCHLDKIWFVPAACSPHKTDQQPTSNEARVEMLKLAVGGHPHFDVSTIEVDRGGVSYTVDAVTTGSTANGTAWRATLRPATASHDEYTISASCAGCAADSAIALERVVFGDVYFCSGQSVSCLDPGPRLPTHPHPCLQGSALSSRP